MKLSAALLSSLLVGALARATSKRATSLPLVESEKLQRALRRSNLLDHAQALMEHAKLSNGTRAFGTKGHNATVAYIKQKLDATGYYDTELQTLDYVLSEGTANFTAFIRGVQKSFDTEWFLYVPAGTAEGKLVVVNDIGCVQSDFPPEVRGSIALIKRGDCDFGLKIAYAGAAGATGVIIYNNEEGLIGGGTLVEPVRPEGPYLPAGAVSGAVGTALVAAIAAGEVKGKVFVDAINENRPSSNVLATTKGGDRNHIVMVGGHTDSVPAGPGINDNGSGSMGLLEIALQLPRWSVNNAVRFAFWTVEEYGLIGSSYWINSQTQTQTNAIALYLNADMIASPNFGYFIHDGDGSAFNNTGPPGSDHIEHMLENYFKELGIPTAPARFGGRSDYRPFIGIGIPCGGIFTGAEGNKTEQEAAWWGGRAGQAYDPNYHKAGDVITNLNAGAWVRNTKAFAHAIAMYSNSLEGIPRPVKRSVLPKRQHSHAQRRCSACNHEYNSM